MIIEKGFESIYLCFFLYFFYRNVSFYKFVKCKFREDFVFKVGYWKNIFRGWCNLFFFLVMLVFKEEKESFFKGFFLLIGYDVEN